jgi:hypothetical protein
MNRDPDRDERVKYHGLEYRVPRDRQLDSLEIHRPGDVVVITDTLFPVHCPYCERRFEESTEWASMVAFSDHHEEKHPDMPAQYEVKSWFRSLMKKREADIAKLKYEHEDHDY